MASFLPSLLPVATGQVLNPGCGLPSTGSLARLRRVNPGISFLYHPRLSFGYFFPFQLSFR